MIQLISYSCAPSIQNNKNDKTQIMDLGVKTPAKLDCDILQRSVDHLCQSDLFQKLYNFVRQCGWDIVLAETLDHDYQLNVYNFTLTVNSQGLSKAALKRSLYFQNQIMMALIRGVRDIWHEEKSGCFEEEYQIEDLLLLERVRAADCDVITLGIAWDLRCLGHDNLWRHAVASNIGDCALKLQKEMARLHSDPSGKSALRAAFTQWFMDEKRIQISDHETLNYLDSCLSDPQAQWGENPIKADIIESLAMLPDHTTYLQKCGPQILINPLFKENNDLANHEHMTQIMREIETLTIGSITFRDKDLARRLFPVTY